MRIDSLTTLAASSLKESVIGSLRSTKNQKITLVALTIFSALSLVGVIWYRSWIKDKAVQFKDKAVEYKDKAANYMKKKEENKPVEVKGSEPTTESPKEPTIETPKEPTTEAPKETTIDAPKEPTTEAPKETTIDAPKEPTAETTAPVTPPVQKTSSGDDVFKPKIFATKSF